MFNSLRVRLTLLFVILTIVPLLIVGTFIALRGFNTLQDQTVEFQKKVAEQTAVSLKDFFSERQSELTVLTQVYGLTSLPFEEQRNVLSSLLSKQPAYYELTLLDSAGQETIHLTRGEIIQTNNFANRSDHPLFQEAISTKSVSFSPVYFNDKARDRLITIAVPIEDLFTGETASVLIAEVRFQNVSDAILRNLNLKAGEDVYILDQNGVVIAHQNPNLVLKETIFALPENNGRQPGLSSRDAVLAMDTIELPNLDLIVVAETTYANATALASDLRQLAMSIIFATLIVSGLVVTFVVRRIVNPISNLSHVAQAIQEGDFSQRADVKRKDEIGRLAATFNNMTDRLEQTLKGLQDHVDELEKARIERENLIKDLQGAKRLAEENSRLKSEFLSTMSHELRTPLNAIEGFTGIILNKIGGTDYNEKTEGYMNRIRSNSRRLLQLINDFLDLSRIEAGRLELVNQPFSPVTLAKRWQDEIAVLAEKKGLQFEINLDTTMPQTLYGDEEAISKIALNLLANAIKFTEQGEIKLSLQNNEETWGIIVEDTGIGIPPHAREFIFEEFRQVDQSSKRKYGGTGLGLAIVQKYTRAMGGTVQLKSEYGKGSIFSVSLPIKVTA